MISERFFERRGEEIANTGSFSSPSVSLLSALGGGPTTSGIRISESTAEGIPAWFAVRGVVSETVGQVPLKIFRKLPRGKQVDESHSLYYVLHDQFNPEMTAYEGKELLTRNVCDWGNGYAEIVRDKAGRVSALWPLAPNRMSVDRDAFNRRRYRYRNGNGQGFEWIWNPTRPPIFHLRANSLDGLVGRSAIRILADCFGLTKAAEEFGARFFSNNAMPSAVATFKGKLTPQQKTNLRESWTKVHGGLSNAHRIAILENDIKLEKMGVDPQAAQFMELRMLQIEEIARTLRVPLFMIQHMTKSTSWGTGIEQMLIAFNSITMMPWYTIWQQTIARDLLTQKSFATHAALFVVEAMMRGDFKTRQDGLAIQFDKGVITRNEWRALEDRSAMDDEFADEAMVPINNVVPASLAREVFTKQAQGSPAAPAPADVPADDDDPTNDTAARLDAIDQELRDLRNKPAAPPVFNVDARTTIAEGAVQVTTPVDARTTVEPAQVSVQPPDVHVDARTTVAEGAVRSEVTLPAPVHVERVTTVERDDQRLIRQTRTRDVPLEGT